MKKSIVIFIISTLLSFFATNAVWANNVVSLDYLANGEYETGKAKTDMEQSFILSANIPLEQFKFGFEYLTGETKKIGGTTLDLTGFTVKGGYAFVDQEGIRVEGTLGYYSRTYQDTTTEVDSDITAVMIGLDSTFKLNEATWITLSLGYSVNGEIESQNVETDTDILTGKIKLNYMFTENVGAGFGYIHESIKPETGEDSNLQSFTAGLIFRF